MPNAAKSSVLVPAFSCKRRGFCPSCGARRMIETAAHLIDHVLPPVPIRQWVLSFPWPLRLLFASRPDVLSDVLAIVIRAIEADLIQRAGLTRQHKPRTGAVTLIQRFGSALNLNVHLHMLILDGVYLTHPADSHTPRFRRVNAPTTTQLQALHQRIIARVIRYLTRAGLLIPDPEQPWLDIEPQDTLDHLAAASTRYRVAIGTGFGQRNLTIKNPALERPTMDTKPFTDKHNGFSINCAVACQPHQRERLLAALVPRPRANLTRYHGVFAPNAKIRKLITPSVNRERGKAALATHAKEQNKQSAGQESERENQPPGTESLPTAPLSWAQRLKRVFNIDIELCPNCGGKLRHIADITDPDVIERILKHLKLRGPPAPVRADPHPFDTQSDLFA